MAQGHTEGRERGLKIKVILRGRDADTARSRCVYFSGVTSYPIVSRGTDEEGNYNGVKLGEARRTPTSTNVQMAPKLATVYPNVARHRHDAGVISIPTVTAEKLRPRAKEGIQPRILAIWSQKKKGGGNDCPPDCANFVAKIVYPPP